MGSIPSRFWHPTRKFGPQSCRRPRQLRSFPSPELSRLLSSNMLTEGVAVFLQKNFACQLQSDERGELRLRENCVWRIVDSASICSLHVAGEYAFWENFYVARVWKASWLFCGRKVGGWRKSDIHFEKRF